MKFSLVIIIFFWSVLNLEAKSFCKKELQKAKTLMLKNKRVLMAKKMNKIIEAKPCKKNKVKNKKKLEDYFEFFLTDKAQQSFEKAKSMWKLKPKEAIGLLKTSLNNKQYNLLAVELLQKIYLQQNLCAKAYSLSLELEHITPHLKRNKKMLFYSLVCLKNYKKAKALKRYFVESKDLYDKLLFVEILKALNMNNKAKKTLYGIKDKQNPEVLRYKFLMESKKSTKLKLSRMYKEACIGFSIDIENGYWDLKKPCENQEILSYSKDASDN